MVASISERIIQYRTEKGLTQDELANQLYVSRSLVSLWEHGKRVPCYMDVVKLASIFDVDVAELLDYNETITPLLEIQLINKEVEEFTNSSYDSSSLETRKSILSKFLSSRSQTDNTIFLDRYLFMKPYTEIARELNMNENAIRTRLSRLRKTLNKYLKEKENDY